ncbi:hypothetical protein [Kribbella sp. CA-294648]|uniref:hypothetical protein n=1 Tax=Kribbella sp. CA-294648 TaxID=3239948 RepID=UPI003D8DB45D
MRRGKVAWVGVIGCLVMSLAGCGPRWSKATVGITVDDTGKPVLVLRDCDADVLRVSVTHRAPEPPTTADPASVDYIASPPVKGTAQFSLLTGSSSWRMAGQMPQGVGEYTAYLAVEEDRRSWGTVRFTLSDLELLKPGQVWHQSAAAGTTITPGTSEKVSTIEQFFEPVCG